ncbi:MAG: hypothetical protein Q4Q62_07670 [Thermoplasmata archaeon]|nr:hypothetical protein [Thermoplasmata archaeon]
MSKDRVKTGPRYAWIFLLYGLVATIVGCMETWFYSTHMDHAQYITMTDHLRNLPIDLSGFMPAWQDGAGTLMTISMVGLLLSGLLSLCCYIAARRGQPWQICAVLCALSGAMGLVMCAHGLFVYPGLFVIIAGMFLVLAIFRTRDGYGPKA